MRRAIIGISGFVALLVASSCVGTRPTRLPIAMSLPHRSERLGNGLEVVTHDDESSPVVSVALAVATGAGDDPADREGLAHAVEHLAFRAEHSSGPVMRIRLDRMGASFNAFTSSEATIYLATAPKSGLGALVQAFADIAHDPVEGVSPAVLDTERGVLDNERRFRDENGSPGEVVDRLRALVYGNRPRGKPIGGTAQSLRAITLEDVKAFASSHYRPGAMTLVVSGPLGNAKNWVAPFAAIPAPTSPLPVAPTGSPKPPMLDAAGIEHVPSSVPAPELWLGWVLPGAYGSNAATLEIVANMASGALASGAWDRHADVTGGFCFLDRGHEASMLACRAYLSTADHAGAVKHSLIDVIRKGIATRASERDWRYVYTRMMATEELLHHERLAWRTEELLLGAHFAKDPGFSLKRVRDLEAAERSEIMTLYDGALTAETARAVLAVPGSSEQLAALPLTKGEFESRGAEVPDAGELLAGIEPTHTVETVLSNGLRVLAAQRQHARFQTVLLGCFDGVARAPPAVADAARWSYRSYIVEPPTGVLQTMHWDADATRWLVRGPAGDSRVLLRRLDEGLDHYDFKWKSEAYLDFARGQKQRENDPREKTPREFRKQLFFDHPYGAAVLSADVDAVTVRQIRDWYDAVHRPENALLVLVGSESPEKLLQAAAEELGSWQRSAKREAPVARRDPLVSNGRNGPRLIVGDRPTESQVNLEIGCVLTNDAAGAAAAEDVFAALLREKLDDELRQRAGATYGVNVSMERLRGGTSVLHVTSAVANEELRPSLKTLYAWFVGDEDLVSEDLLRLGRFDALQRYVVGTETSADLANEIFEYARRGLSMGDLDEQPKRIARVDLAEANRLLATCRKTSLFSAVGDERRIRAAWPAH